MTIDREHLELIQAELDGELDGPARAELARFLLAHPEARAEREALERVCDALAKVPAEEPPADLQSNIVAALPPTRHGRGPSGAGRGDAPLAFMARPAALRYAAGLVGVALVATLAYELASTHAPLPSNVLVGTMGQPAADDGLAADFGPVRDEVRIEAGVFAAVVSLHGTPTDPRVSVSVESGAGLEVVARAGDQEVHLGDGSRRASQSAWLAEFAPLPQPGTTSVEVAVVEPSSGAVLHRTTLSFE